MYQKVQTWAALLSYSASSKTLFPSNTPQEAHKSRLWRWFYFKNKKERQNKTKILINKIKPQILPPVPYPIWQLAFQFHITAVGWQESRLWVFLGGKSAASPSSFWFQSHYLDGWRIYSVNYSQKKWLEVMCFWLLFQRIIDMTKQEEKKSADQKQVSRVLRGKAGGWQKQVKRTLQH